jgi:hypothetical protein
VVSYLPAFPPKSCMHSSSPPCVLHALLISSSLTSSKEVQGNMYVCMYINEYAFCGYFKKTRLLFTFRLSIKAWLIRNVLLAIILTSYGTFAWAWSSCTQALIFFFCAPTYPPLSPPPSPTLWTEFFSRMINPSPSFQTYDEEMKGEG